jgi:hypothetical protein
LDQPGDRRHGVRTGRGQYDHRPLQPDRRTCATADNLLKSLPFMITQAAHRNWFCHPPDSINRCDPFVAVLSATKGHDPLKSRL